MFGRKRKQPQDSAHRFELVASLSGDMYPEWGVEVWENGNVVHRCGSFGHRDSNRKAALMKAKMWCDHKIEIERIRQEAAETGPVREGYGEPTVPQLQAKIDILERQLKVGPYA